MLLHSTLHSPNQALDPTHAEFYCPVGLVVCQSNNLAAARPVPHRIANLAKEILDGFTFPRCQKSRFLRSEVVYKIVGAFFFSMCPFITIRNDFDRAL